MQARAGREPVFEGRKARMRLYAQVLPGQVGRLFSVELDLTRENAAVAVALVMAAAMALSRKGEGA